MTALDLPMTDDPEYAGDVYLVGLEPRRRSRLRTLVYAGLDLWCATAGGTMELTRGIDVVVRHRYDGRLALVVPVVDAAAGAVTMEHVRDQFDTLSPAEFRAAWGID